MWKSQRGTIIIIVTFAHLLIIQSLMFTKASCFPAAVQKNMWKKRKIHQVKAEINSRNLKLISYRSAFLEICRRYSSVKNFPISAIPVWVHVSLKAARGTRRSQDVKFRQTGGAWKGKHGWQTPRLTGRGETMCMKSQWRSSCDAGVDLKD